MTQNKALTVYRASAGSGKTFTLAVEYIKQLIKNPKEYEKILAVTFTNKATEEMKRRIVSQLYGLANNLKDSKSYMDKIKKDLNVSEQTITERADEALRYLLHNYNNFRVQTIDAFFQSILRNMAKELGLGNNMRVVLNDKQIISEAVDNLFDTLDSDQELMNWIMGYIGEKMDKNTSWDITKDVKKFGMNISKEFYKSNEHLLQHIDSDADFYKKYKSCLKKLEKEILNYYKGFADKFFTELESNGFVIDNLLRKSTGVAGYFIKMRNGDISNDIANTSMKNAYNSEDNWGGPGYKEDMAPVAREVFMPILHEAEKDREKSYKILKSIQLTLSNLNKMRLLSGIRKEMDRLNRDNARFMLSNTQTTLNQMIKGGGNDAPFIFEKIGAYISHIMIDEFQDTSTIQWDNFKVLLEECLSHVDTSVKDDMNLIHNLIVGDVKQSIYRFRSGDWRLLNEIKDEFDDTKLNIETLDTNWRSQRNIIAFNNVFFKKAINIVAEDIMPEDANRRDAFLKENDIPLILKEKMTDFSMKLKHAYDDVAQEIPANKPQCGLVKVELLPFEGEEFVNEAMDHALYYIKGLTQQGANQADICIIVRDNKEATLIANYFAQKAPELRIISDQAFKLNASPLVMMIINAMRFLSNHKNIEAKVTLMKMYLTYIKKENTGDEELLTDDTAFNKYMPDNLKDEHELNNMLTMPLYELTEHLYRVLSLDQFQGQQTYTCAFFDGLKKYLEDTGGTLDDFLCYWDEDLNDKAISVDSADSIRIITIHKSKGLEFKHIVMPFCNWKIGPKQGLFPTLWCKIDKDNVPEIGELPFIPVDYTGRKSMMNSIYEEYGIEEWMQDLTDNLNLLYVAFTRAKNSLYAISDQNNKDSSRTSLIMKTISSITENDLPGVSIKGFEEYDEYQKKLSSQKKSKKKDKETEKLDREAIIMTFGQHYIDPGKEENKDEKREEANVFETSPEPITIGIHSYASESIDFRQSNKSREFANDSLNEEDINRYTTIGSVMHSLFSKIQTKADIDKLLRQFEFDGIIYDDDLTPEMLRNNLREKFENSSIAYWFSDKWTVFNECNILQLVNGKIKESRPDRVITDGKETIVIDYKFGKRNDSYKEQVRNYMKLMADMNYPDVKGYIWYVNESDGVEEV